MLQLSRPVTEPQFLPRREQNVAAVSDVHPHTFDVLQVSGAAQLPQVAVRATLQLSSPTTVPQLEPDSVQNSASLSGMQPHTLGVAPAPPPQVCPVGQVEPHE